MKERVIPSQSGAAFLLKRGQILKVIDPEGQQVSDLFCVSANDRNEWFSAGRSIDYNDTIYLTEGHTLYSNRSSPMLKWSKDTCGRHDALMTPCSLKMFQIVAGNREYHPSCDENLAKNLAQYDISPDRIGTTLNLFMNVHTAPETGKLSIHPPRSKPGDYVELEALMDLVVGLTACSHEETNAGKCKPIRYQIA
jgi:uncharacterized protein YcgI (DUF1989 family)